MTRRIALSLLACAAAMPAKAQQRPASPASGLSQTSSYRLVPRSQNCTFGYQTTNVRYTVVGSGAITDAGYPHLVLEEKTTIQQCENLEGPTNAEVSVTARPAAHPEAQPVWMIHRHGEDAAVVDSFPGQTLYRITEYGCCGSENADTYYSMATGRQLFTADMPLLLLDVKPFGTGFVAVHDAQAAEQPPGARSDSTVIAVVAFGAPGGTVQRAVIHGPSANFRVAKVELVARDAAGHVKRGGKLDIDSGIDARWTVAVAVSIEGMTEGAAAGRVDIPIANGQLMGAQAHAPAPFRVVAATAPH